MSKAAGRGCLGTMINFVLLGGLIAFCGYFAYYYVVMSEKFLAEAKAREKAFLPIIAKARKILKEAPTDENTLKALKDKAKPAVKSKFLVVRTKPTVDGLNLDSISTYVEASRIASEPAEVHTVFMTHWHEELHIKYSKGNTYLSKCSFAVIDLDQERVVYRGSLAGDPPTPPESMVGKAPHKEMIELLDRFPLK